MRLLTANHRHERSHQDQKVFSLGDRSAIDGMALDGYRIK